MSKSLIWSPPQSKRELDLYLRAFINVELTDNIVDFDSTTSPLEAVWIVYRAMLTNEGDKEFIACAARNSGKTLIGSVISFLGMILFRRNIVIMSATKAQSGQMISYLDSHFRKMPDLEKHFISDSILTKELVELPKNSYTSRNGECKCVIVAATLKGANSKRGNLLILDEVDQVKQAVLDEVTGVIDPTRDEHRFDPITIALSSRKVPDGPLQERIDRSNKGNEGCKLLKWSFADVLDVCPYKKENEQYPTSTALISQEDLSIRWDTELGSINEQEQNDWLPRTQYHKCKDCHNGKIYKLCQGFSMNAIEGEQSLMRRRHSFGMQILSQIKDPAIIIAQYNNWKPETRGSVFRMFKEEVHTKTLIEAYKWAMEVPRGVMTPDITSWSQLAKILKQAGWTITVGIDYGWSPDPAVAVFIAYDTRTDRAVVLNTLYKNYSSNHEWSILVMDYAKENNVYVDIYAPDTADGAALSYFAKRGKTAVKKPMRIENGVSQTRGLLSSTIRGTSMIIVKDNNFYYRFISEITGWRHKKNVATGEWKTNEFEDSNNHGPDALRYGLNPFIKNDTISNKKQNVFMTGCPDKGSFAMRIDKMSNKIGVTQEDYESIMEEVIYQQSGNHISLAKDDEEDEESGCLFL